MQATIGSVSTATMRTQDLLTAFSDELETLGGATNSEGIIRDARLAVEHLAAGGEDDESIAETLTMLFDALGEIAPEGCYFGAHPGDGADYGFWPCEDDGTGGEA